jgi:hypothetical protein
MPSFFHFAGFLNRAHHRAAHAVIAWSNHQLTFCMDPLHANAAIAADTARILSAVDAMMHSATLGRAELFSAVTPVANGAALPPPMPHPITTRSVGVVSDGPITIAVGVQYGDGCGWGLRSAATNTEALADVAPPTVVAKCAVATGMQTVAPRTQQAATDPIATTTVGSLTDIHGGDIVEVGAVRNVIMRVYEGLCGHIERSVKEKSRSLLTRITKMQSSVKAAEHQVEVVRCNATSTSSRNDVLEKENADLSSQVASLQLAAAAHDKELTIMRSLCEEMARNAEATSAENERLRQQAVFLEGIVHRFEAMMTNHTTSPRVSGAKQRSSRRGARVTFDDDLESDLESGNDELMIGGRSQSSSSGEPAHDRHHHHHHRTADATPARSTPSSVRPPRSQTSQTAVHLQQSTTPPPRYPRGQAHVSSPASVPPIQIPITNAPPPAMDMMRLLYDQCTAALQLADEEDEEDATRCKDSP